MFKKVFSIFVMLSFACNTVCIADDKIEENNLKEVAEAIQTASKISKEPKINSRKAIVLDRNTKQILYGKDEKAKSKMASTTKIMTAMVVIQNTNLNNVVEISAKAAGTGGSRLKLKKGDKISVQDLLYGLLLRSGNDAAVALAEYVGGSVSDFANLMNENAKVLGLENTHFVTPHGLDSDEHYTTAYELALLTDYALNNKIFSQIVNTKTYTININGNNRVISNTNELLGNLNGVYGVKTGFTNGAGRCLVTSIKRGNMDIICIVLGADTKKDRTKDSINLIEYTFKTYETQDFSKKIKEEFKNWNDMNSNRIHIEKGKNKEILFRLEEDKFLYSVLKNNMQDLRIEIDCSKEIKAPIKQETIVGKLIVYYNNQIIREINILTVDGIKEKTVGDYIVEFFRNYNNYLRKVI